eukprot:scaffold2943_cov18-Tisochrysis_lutea.AAC.1
MACMQTRQGQPEPRMSQMLADVSIDLPQALAKDPPCKRFEKCRRSAVCPATCHALLAAVAMRMLKTRSTYPCVHESLHLKKP